MKIVMAASEVAPYSRSGGLGDVTSALARALAQLGQDVQIVTPYYPQRTTVQVDSETGVELTISVGSKQVSGRVLSGILPGSSVQVWLIDQPNYFDRPHLYSESHRDYLDNCERFVFFCRAVAECVQIGLFSPDVLHVHDWQTALLPALLSIEGTVDTALAPVATLMTIHNLSYQGRFWHWDMELTGLDWKYFNWRQMEYFGDLNLLKTGISFADLLTTVSPNFALEIQSDAAGCGLQGILRTRQDELVGILHGIDGHVWNPLTDPFLGMNYSSATVTDGKMCCKKQLREQLLLSSDGAGPLCGCFVDGGDPNDLDFVLSVAERILKLGVQLVLLVDPVPILVDALHELVQKQLGSVAVICPPDDPVMHQLLGAADLFLSPSDFSPFGTNQMIQLAYGAVPIARKVGGNVDVIRPANSDGATDEPNGFLFDDNDPAAFIELMEQILEKYSDEDGWRRLQQAGMQADHSWESAAKEYVRAYQLAQRRHALSLVQTNSTA